MEVHHHAHDPAAPHHKKNWKSYLWEFVMLFLAVFCGFLAEYQLEHVIEHQREKEYIESMIEDAKADTANISKAIVENTRRVLHLDSLANLCSSYSGKATEDSLLYRHYIYGLIHPAVISPTERTLIQLKNAGGMRLIRNKTAVDSIILYDDMAKKLSDQRSFYELYQNNSIALASTIFSFKKLGIGVSNSQVKDSANKGGYFKLFSNDKTKLMEFANTIFVYEGVVQYYNALLKEMNEHAVNLQNSLRKEYHLD